MLVLVLVLLVVLVLLLSRPWLRLRLLLVLALVLLQPHLLASLLDGVEHLHAARGTGWGSPAALLVEAPPGEAEAALVAAVSVEYEVLKAGDAVHSDSAGDAAAATTAATTAAAAAGNGNSTA